MKKIVSYVIMLVCIVLASCNPGNGSLPPTAISATVAQTATVKIDTPTTVVPTMTVPPTASLTSEPTLIRSCAKLISDFPPELNTEGPAITQGYSANPATLLVNIAAKTTSTILDANQGLIEGPFISPDHQKMAYRAQDGTAVGSHIVIHGATDPSGLRIPWKAKWRRLAGWIDNQRLWISQKVDPKVSNDDLMVALDLASQQVKELPPVDDPHHFVPVGGNESAFWGGFASSLSIYDPTLQLVAYPRADTQQNAMVLVLRDLSLGKELTSVQMNDLYAPEWLPDGSKLIFIKRGPGLNPRLTTEDIASLDRSGKEETLTSFGATSQLAEIHGFAVSPDGSRIAFWADMNVTEPYPEIYPDAASSLKGRMVILDVKSGKMWNTCIPRGMNATAPVWSPDGRYLVAMDYYKPEAPQAGHCYIIDILKKDSFLLTDDYCIIGWLKPQ